MKRKSDCLEDKQKEMVKKLKLEKESSSTDEDEESGDEPMDVDVASAPIKKIRSNKKINKSKHMRSKDTSYKNFFSKFKGNNISFSLLFIFI